MVHLSVHFRETGRKKGNGEVSLPIGVYLSESENKIEEFKYLVKFYEFKIDFGSVKK